MKSKTNNLKSLCETRWVDRHDAVLQFQLNLSRILDSLFLISKWKESETSSKAQSLITSLTSSAFIVSLHCLSNLLCLTVNLSKLLQSKNIDRVYIKNIISNLLETLQKKRSSANDDFASLFSKIKNTAEKIDVEISMPRLSFRQKNRENPIVNNCEDYYRISIYIPLLDNVIEDLKFRFDEKNLIAFDFSFFIPYTLEKN